MFDSSLAKQELGLGQKNWTKNYAKEFLKLDIKTSELDPVKNMDNILEAASSISDIKGAINEKRTYTIFNGEADGRSSKAARLCLRELTGYTSTS